jgi:hypothetical protein
VTPDHRPVPAEPIDLAPVTPLDDVGAGLRNGFWMIVGFWGGVIAVVLICWS